MIDAVGIRFPNDFWEAGLSPGAVCTCRSALISLQSVVACCSCLIAERMYLGCISPEKGIRGM